MVEQLTHAIIYADITNNINLGIKYNGIVMAGIKYNIILEYLLNKSINQHPPFIQITEQSKIISPVQETIIKNKTKFTFVYNAPYLNSYTLEIYPFLDKKDFYIPVRVIVQYS
jgi:hypothetical protein